MPPVTNTLMPARAASSIVPLTVVAPSSPLPSTNESVVAQSAPTNPPVHPANAASNKHLVRVFCGTQLALL
jgi:hypothetical protein